MYKILRAESLINNVTIKSQNSVANRISDDLAKGILQDVINAETRIIIFAGFTTDFKTVFARAKRLGIAGSGYVWITTDGVTPSQLANSDFSGVLSVFPTERYDSPVRSEFKSTYQSNNSFGNPTLSSGNLDKDKMLQFDYFSATCIDLIVYGLDNFLKSNSSRNIIALAAG